MNKFPGVFCDSFGFFTPESRTSVSRSGAAFWTNFSFLCVRKKQHSIFRVTACDYIPLKCLFNYIEPTRKFRIFRSDKKFVYRSVFFPSAWRDCPVVSSWKEALLLSIRIFISSFSVLRTWDFLEAGAFLSLFDNEHKRKAILLGALKEISTNFSPPRPRIR